MAPRKVEESDSEDDTPIDQLTSSSQSASTQPVGNASQSTPASTTQPKEEAKKNTEEQEVKEEQMDVSEDKSSSSPPKASAVKLEEKEIKEETVDQKPIKDLTTPKKESKSTDVKEEDEDDDDDEPISAIKAKDSRKRKTVVKKEEDNSDDEYEPDAKPKRRAKTPTKKRATKKRATKTEEEDSDDDMQPETKKTKAPAKGKAATKGRGKQKREADDKASGKTKRRKKEEEEQPIHKWWLEKELPDGQRWRTLEHHGPLFAPEYEPLPKTVYMLYDGEKMELTPETEEVAGFYAMMLERDYVKKDLFNKNFMKDWKTVMTKEEKAQIKDLKKCDFSLIHAYYKKKAEERKAASKEEKEERKKKEAEIKAKYGVATMDGRPVPIGNFRIEPPGLFQGRGEHPKQGMLKRRVMPEQVIINIGENDKAPEPPQGHKWKEIRHDNKVTWLASWTENVQGQNKYVLLAPDSHIKGRSDWKKYETARNLKKHVDKIRADYTKQLKSKEMFERQRATALYFIDKLALRAGGEKDADEEADTVGCCNLRVEHIEAADDHVVEFDFLGKDSIRYQNQVKVDPQVWKNVKIFKRPPKEEGDELFDRLTTPTLNKYLQSLMPGLTAKVFRTYNASITLQEQLKDTPVDGTLEQKLLAYQRANRAVAILCNHQRAPPKTFDKQVERLDEALEKIETDLAEAIKERKTLKNKAKNQKSSMSESEKKKTMKRLEALKKKIDRLQDRKQKKEIAKVDKQEGKTIALGTSKLNYLDPRISVWWAKKHDVPIEKVYNKTQRKKFRWAIEMIDEEFIF